MGIDATALCTALPKRFFIPLSGPATLKIIAETTRTWADTNGLGPLTTITPEQDGSLAVLLVPVGDPILFTAAHDRLTAAFRSSNTGPGFHSAAVDLLDHLAEQLKIVWGWTASDGTPLDETDFGRTRDFAALSSRLAQFLKDLARTTEGLDGTHGISFCLPLGLGGVPEHVATPLGLAPLSWVSEVLSASDKQLLSLAQSFYPWWQPGLGADTLQSLLSAMLWQNAEWRPPHDEDDSTHTQITHLRQMLMRLHHALPADLETALAAYDHHRSSDRPPASQGIGYRRRLINERIYQSWSIDRPGYARRVPDGDSAAWEHPGFWLGATSMRISLKPGAPPIYPWSADCPGPDIAIRPGIVARLTARKTDEQGQSLQQAFVVSARENSFQLLLLTLSSHLDWPYDAFPDWVASITCPDLSEGTASPVRPAQH